MVNFTKYLSFTGWRQPQQEQAESSGGNNVIWKFILPCRHAKFPSLAFDSMDWEICDNIEALYWSES